MPASPNKGNFKMIVVKFVNIAGGLWFEQPKDSSLEEYPENTRCFRFKENGDSEYALIADVKERGERARFYSHIYGQKNFIFA